MKKILVPCDGSDHALRAVQHAASEVASTRLPVELELLHVLARVPAQALPQALSAGRIDARFPPPAQQALRAAATLLEAGGIRFQAALRYGDAATEIAAHARATGCDEIIMGTRGLGTLGSALMGSVASEVVHLAEVPVTLVRQEPSPVRPLTRILVPSDGSDNAVQALRYAARIAKENPAVQLELVHVLSAAAYPPRTALFRPDELTRLCPAPVEQTLAPSRDLLRAEGLPCEARCRMGDPAREITAQASESGCGRIIMGTRGMSRIANLMIGSVAARVVHFAQVPVTLVK